MRHPSLSPCRPLPRRVYVFGVLGLSVLALAVGCAELPPAAVAPFGPIIRGAQESSEELHVLPPIVVGGQSAHQTKEEQLPPAKEVRPDSRLAFSAPNPAKVVPINLDTVLRLAETQNGQTAVAREKLQEALANHDVVKNAWLPDLWLGAGWYRHEGGISNEDGTITKSSFSSMFDGVDLNGRFDLRDAVYKKVDAERRIWQQRAEVSKFNSEALLEATTTYVDLLSARAAHAITLKTEAKLQDLLNPTLALAKNQPAAEADVARIQTELQGQQQLLRKFKEGALAATAKLIYLLGLDPQSELVIVDHQLAAFTLVDADRPADDLVAQAQQQGPGIRDLEGLLHLIQEASAKEQGLARLLPVFDVRMAEGGFGTGPGDSMIWDNRWDFGVAMKWNLTEWATSRDRQRVTQAKIGQAHATYQDLRAKLTLGVQESREAVLSARDQLDIGQKQLKFASDAYERSKNRLAQAPLKDRSPSEVLLSIRSLNGAHLAYLTAIRDQDKAQLRLAILTGTIGCGGER